MRIVTSLIRHLGRCSRCMRQSCVFMLGSWGLTIALMGASTSSLVLHLVEAISVAATVLWLAHLVAFAARTVKGELSSEREATVRNASDDPSIPPRRRFLFEFAKNFLLVAAATALPASAALAQTKTQSCLTCCASLLSNCGSSERCNTLYQNCVASCNSGGETPADWRCWS